MLEKNQKINLNKKHAIIKNITKKENHNINNIKLTKIKTTMKHKNTTQDIKPSIYEIIIKEIII